MAEHYSKGDYSHLSKAIIRQAKELEARDEILHAVKRLLEKNYMVSAMNMIDSHFKNIEFKG